MELKINEKTTALLGNDLIAKVQEYTPNDQAAAIVSSSLLELFWLNAVVKDMPAPKEQVGAAKMLIREIYEQLFWLFEQIPIDEEDEDDLDFLN